MQFFAESLDLSDSAFTLLRDLIHRRLGIYFEPGKKSLLADKLSPLVIERGFTSFMDLYYLLKYDNDEADWRQVMDALSVQETYFWREFDQVRALVAALVPQWAAAHPNETLRIWSAACASGEEPLSIAMALNEAGWFERLPIEVWASDASPGALAKAKKGVYRGRSFRSLPAELHEKYFTAVSHPNPGLNHQSWQIDRDLHGRIHWRLANLADEREIANLAAAQVIFCRNVFIYFSPETVQNTVHHFFEQMPSPGYLFIGASESLFRLTTRFALEELSGAFVYVKP